MGILENVCSHDDLLQLNDDQREILCQEIRDFLISHVAKTGGHLASNLGVVELTVAIETVFNTFEDRLVFDVGHQSYVHKLLTGRQAAFDGLRQYRGMAGFPKPGESDADAFVAGHASSSISIALGMARARSLSNANYNVVAMIGDGAATGGMAYEGLNDVAVSKEPIVVILNDNEMSIDHNVGGLASHLSVLRTKERYLGMKRKYRSFMYRIPGGKAVHHLTSRIKSWIRRVLIPTTIFENMGLTYIGPVDGHDLPNLISILRSARDLKRPVLVHVLTQKGLGYRFAEEDPSKYHGIGRFDPETGLTASNGEITFSSVFGSTMCDLAVADKRVCAITAAMPGGTGLLEFKKQFPERLFDVGIAEEHAVSMAGGLSKQGYRPVVALYSTFLQRSYDMLLQDIAMLHLHVVIAVDRAGLVGEDGETHHGVFDVGFLRQIPGMSVLCPASTTELRDMLRWAVLEYDGPIAVRYPRGGDGSYTQSAWAADSSKVVQHRSGRDVTIITYGHLINKALAAAKLLAEKGIEATVLRLLSVSDYSIDDVAGYLTDGAKIFIMEEICHGSGIGESLAYRLQNYGKLCVAEVIDLGIDFVTHGDIASLHRERGLDEESVCSRIEEALNSEN